MIFLYILYLTAFYVFKYTSVYVNKFSPFLTAKNVDKYPLLFLE